MKLFWKEQNENHTIYHIGFLKIKKRRMIKIPLSYHLSLHKHASYSQAGEDKVIAFIMSFFANMDATKLRFLDIGANYPHEGNNTYYYYTQGSRGVLVEPNEKLCEISKGARPEDVIINAGIKFDEKEEATYYAFEDDTGINTFDEARAKEMIEKGHTPLPPKKIKMVSVNDVIEKYFENGVVDYLSLDAENVDILILKSIDFDKYRPKIICVEADKGNTNEIKGFMESKDYMLMADTSINYIFLAKEEYAPNTMYV